MIAISSPIIVTLIFTTGIWSPNRWMMYFDEWQEVVSVSFYGQIVDDKTSQPVAGAKVSIELDTVNWAFILGGKTPGDERTFMLTTDHDGHFQIINKWGYTLKIKDVSKQGFTFYPPLTPNGSNYATAFYYSEPGAGKHPHIPDPHNPVAFKLRADADGPPIPTTKPTFIR